MRRGEKVIIAASLRGMLFRVSVPFAIFTWKSTLASPGTRSRGGSVTGFSRFDINMAGIRMDGHPRRDDRATHSTRSVRTENAGVTLLALF